MKLRKTRKKTQGPLAEFVLLYLPNSPERLVLIQE